MHKIDDLRLRPDAVPTPLLVSLRRNLVQSNDGRARDTIWVSSGESGEQFGTVCGPGTAILGPVMGGKPYAQKLVRFVAFLDRLRPTETDVSLAPKDPRHTLTTRSASPS
jgi:hypothetical protein